VELGTVSGFDARRGYGTVVTRDGREHVFHLTAIADGSRTIEAGTPVAFEVVAGHLGRWEAADLHRLPA
jgi:cold shock CspA family protein